MNKSEDDIEEAVKNGYLKTDYEFLREDQRGGSCSVTALIRKGNLVVSNAGDCRAVVSRGGVAEALTSDHRPSREDEKERIEAMVKTQIIIKILFVLFNWNLNYHLILHFVEFNRADMWIVAMVFGEFMDP